MKSANFVNFKDISMKTEFSRETCSIDQQWQDLRTSHDFFSIGAHDAYLTATQSSPSNTLDQLFPKNSFRWRSQLNLDLDFLQNRYFETNCAQVTNMDTLVSLSSEDIFKFQTNRDSPAVEKTLIQIYIKSELGADAEALKIAFDYIESNLAEGDTKKIDSFLGKFQPERVKRIVSVGVVRSTYRARTILTEWNHCFARVAKTLNENNQSPHKYLRGLYPTNGQRLLAKRRAV